MYCEYLAELQTVCHEYWKRICGLEGDKYDLERASALKKMEVKRLNATIKLKKSNKIRKPNRNKSIPTKMTFDWIEWLISYFLI